MGLLGPVLHKYRGKTAFLKDKLEYSLNYRKNILVGHFNFIQITVFFFHFSFAGAGAQILGLMHAREALYPGAVSLAHNCFFLKYMQQK